jgi:hypothetical protein
VSGSAVLQALRERFAELTPEVRAELAERYAARLPYERWIPNPGPQTEAYYSEADEVFFGGNPGGGKSALGIGLAITQHTNSLLLRRTYKEASKFVDEIEEILGTREGFNGHDDVWKFEGRKIDIGGCQYENDKQKYKGDPHDLFVFDELSDFSKSQYEFITIWNRSSDPDQRCRVFAAGNPPTTVEGLWVIEHWGPWLDPRHPYPAKPGELRWYLQGKPVSGPGPYEVERNGQKEWVRARSRTFIPSDLNDNPFLAETGYSSVLAGLSGELSEAYFRGNFANALEDKPGQVIPTTWILEAQARWTAKPPDGIPMCAIGVDIAQGGRDEMVLAPRYDGWFDKFTKHPGRSIIDGPTAAAEILKVRLHGAIVGIDLGGGFGGDCFGHLGHNIGRENMLGWLGGDASVARTADRKLGFFNKRSQAYWQLREALNPAQVGGSPIAFPTDDKLLADLTAPTFEVVNRTKIKITPKEDVVKLLGRSPDTGDAVTIAWQCGPRYVTHGKLWREDQRRVRGVPGHVPTVNMGKRREVRR